MISNLIPNMAKHFLYTVLQHDYESGSNIVKVITKLHSEEVGDFVIMLGANLDNYFNRLEVDVEGYDEIKHQALDELKQPYHDDLDGLN